MPLPKLMLDIDESGYTISPGSEVNSVSVESGPSWRRRDFFGAPIVIDLQFPLEERAYEYLMAFWRTTLSRGVLPFLIDLVIDSGSMEEYQAVFVNGVMRTSKSGSAYIVSASLEVKQNPTNAARDQALIALYTSYGENYPATLNRLAKFVNVDMSVLN